jgi:hypothetical protein
MVLRQETSPKLKRLLFEHQSILVPPKGTVRFGKIAHCLAWNKPSYAYLRLNDQIQSQQTYVWMVLWENTSPKLEILFLQHQSIVVPPKGTVRGSKIAHSLACSGPSYKYLRLSHQTQYHFKPMSG